MLKLQIRGVDHVVFMAARPWRFQFCVEAPRQAAIEGTGNECLAEHRQPTGAWEGRPHGRSATSNHAEPSSLRSRGRFSRVMGEAKTLGGKGRAMDQRTMLHSIKMRSIAAGFLMVALVAAGCGSTLPEAEQVAAVEQGQGLGASSVLPPGAEINSEGEIVNAKGEVIGSVEDGVLTTSGDGATTDAARGGKVAGTTLTAPGEDGPGVTQNTIKLGLMYLRDTQEIYDSVGGESYGGSYDYKRGWEALVRYQNEHGGIAGRRIIPNLFAVDYFTSESAIQQQREQCAAWTQDDRVFAGVTYISSDDILKCLHDAGAVTVNYDVLDYWGGAASRQTLREYPYFFEPINLSLERIATAMVDGLYDMRYFAKDAKVGFITWDLPDFRYATQNALIPALRRHGISLVDTAYLHAPQSSSEFGQTTNEASNAALRFKSQGIDHVVSMGSTPWWFQVAAERQQYRPRYGLQSHANPQAQAELLGQQDASNQLSGALAIGWVPTVDVREQDDPNAKDPTRVLCISIMRKAGIEMTGYIGRTAPLQMCDAIWFIATALREASVINQATYLEATNRLKGAYSPGATWSTYFNPTHHDGVSSVAYLRFLDSCTCYRYASRPYTIP